MNRVALKAYAKINLGLSILGCRADGFHELRTIYQTISLADELEIRLSAGPRRVALETSGMEVPAGRENLAVRAAEVLLEELPIKRQVFISLRKRIPPGSGMGGASSDAAAVLRALVYLSRTRLPLERLFHLAAQLGSDVPFFLVGGRAVGLGRGEEVYPLPETPRRTCLVLFPGTGMNTVEAYRLLRAPRLTLLRARPTIESFCGRTNEGVADRLANDFEPLVFRRFPFLAEAKTALLRAGAETAGVSGSGSALFALFEDSRKARQAVQRWQGAGNRVWLARTVSRREFHAQLPFVPNPR